MLEAYPTKHGAGVEFRGAYDDLASLYATMVKLSYTDIGRFYENERLLTIMSYDLRHAYQGDREVYEKTHSFGFKINWITLLFTIACLRQHQTYIPISKLDLANLLILEDATERAMYLYDPKESAELQSFIGRKLFIDDNLTYLVHRTIVGEFFAQRPGKKRFRGIPDLFRKWSSPTQAYQEYKTYIENYIKEHDCDVSEMEVEGIDNEIVW